MLNLWVRVEMPLACSIEDAVAQAILLARKIDAGVVFELNGLRVRVHGETNALEAVREYRERIKWR